MMITDVTFASNLFALFAATISTNLLLMVNGGMTRHSLLCRTQ